MQTLADHCTQITQHNGHHFLK